MRQLSGSDAFFLYSDKPGRHQHVSTIYIYDRSTAADATVDFQMILEHLRERLGTSRILRQRLVQVPLNLDYPYWIHDEHFDLEFHVRHIALPQPGDWRQFCIQVSRLHSRPLDLRRPVWELYVIDGLDNLDLVPKGAFAVMVKVHHVALDDVTEDDFTAVLHDLAVKPEADDVKRRWLSEREPGSLQLLGLAWFNNTIKLMETGQTLVDRLPGIGSKTIDPDDVLHFDQEDAPVTRFDGPVSPHRVWDAVTFDLNVMDKLAQAVPDITLNHVVLAVCSGGLRRYLAAKQELPESSLYALVPLHVHHEGDEGVPGHRVQLIRIKLMTDTDDALERLLALREETAEAEALRPISGEEMSEIQDVLPSTAMTFAARTIAARLGPGKHYRENHNTVIAINPGPTQPLYLCGARLTLYTGMGVLMDNLGLNHTVTSYDGKLTIAPVCDRKMMPDPAFYAECLRQAVEELLQAAAEAAAATPRETSLA